jgi:hypothetical protein
MKPYPPAHGPASTNARLDAPARRQFQGAAPHEPLFVERSAYATPSVPRATRSASSVASAGRSPLRRIEMRPSARVWRNPQARGSSISLDACLRSEGTLS